MNTHWISYWQGVVIGFGNFFTTNLQPYIYRQVIIIVFTCTNSYLLVFFIFMLLYCGAE
jgi:hypothetical protein